MKRFFAAIIFFSCISLSSNSQGDVRDSILRMSLFQFQGGYYYPGADMAERFGPNASIGFSYAYKTGKNILIGADFNYFFGDRVINKDALFHNLRNSDGNVIGIEGQVVNFVIQERGFATGFYAGKIFPVFGPNRNSGLVVKLGINYLEHRIHIETREDDIPPLEGEYLKGYDRKTAGFALNEFIGYQNFSNSRYINFFIGIDFYQGFTRSFRSYNIDLMESDQENRLDLLTGFKVGWVIPIYKQKDNSYYIR